MKKRCPRCNTKTFAEMAICPTCQLNFEKFETATNLEAKKKIKQGDVDQVLMRKGRPSDVKFWRLLLIVLFLGIFGGHNYYVGRYKRGIFFSIFCFIGIVNGAVSSILKVQPKGDLWQLFTLLVMIWGIVLVIWIIDIAKICLNKFKIPVSRSN